MHLLAYVMLLVGGTLAHYSFKPGYVETHSLVEREDPDNDVDGSELVECPVCENASTRSTWLSSNEECAVERGAKAYKKCAYGIYRNKACGNRWDCYRGPKQRCTEKMAYDPFDQRCAPGLYCNPNLGVCTGLDYAVDSNVQWLISPNHRYTLADHRAPATDLHYPIRAKRAV